MKKTSRGFHTMDPHLQRNIASAGGRACHALGLAHKFTTEEAKAAGRKGGLAYARNLKKRKRGGC